MTRDEALRILGLDGKASEADVKAAYKEMAQILHPDRFADNKKLAARATEQFKQVNEARDYLLAGAGSRSRRSGRAGWGGSAGTGAGRGAGSRGAAGAGTGAGSSYAEPEARYADRATALRARLAGIAAARTQLVAQKDAEIDARKIGIILLVGGIIAAVAGRFIRPLLAIAPVAFVWGIIQVFQTQSHIGVIKKHLETLDKERLRTEKELKGL